MGEYDIVKGGFATNFVLHLNNDSYLRLKNASTGICPKHYAHKMTADEIADKFHVSRRTFERRFKKATRTTVVEYIQRIKSEATKNYWSVEENLFTK
jgi:AraC-like DNA-binding protein